MLDVWGIVSLNYEYFFLRTWREMRAEFNLNGGKQVGVSGETPTGPLTMEDCIGTVLLWLLILLIGIVG